MDTKLEQIAVKARCEPNLCFTSLAHHITRDQVSAAFARVSLREPTKFNQLGLGRLQSKAELPQPKTQGVLHAEGIQHARTCHLKIIVIYSFGALQRDLHAILVCRYPDGRITTVNCQFLMLTDF